jgi:hypothetical protein
MGLRNAYGHDAREPPGTRPRLIRQPTAPNQDLLGLALRQLHGCTYIN